MLRKSDGFTTAFLLLALVVGFGMTWSCGSDDGGSSSETGCTSSNDCITGMRCIGGICTANTCESSSNCFSGEICMAYAGNVSQRCVPSCETSEDCEANHRCKNGGCTSIQCSREGDCLTGEYCSALGICTLEGEDPIVEPEERDCEPDDTRCTKDGMGVEICIEDGDDERWIFHEDCPAGCDEEAGICLGGDDDGEEGSEWIGCNPPSQRCVDNAIEICTPNVGYVYSRDCADNEECSVNTISGVAECIEVISCSPNTRECFGSDRYRKCWVTGDGWTYYDCDVGQECDSGFCVAITNCTKNRVRCNDNNNAEKCNGLEWVEYLFCEDNETCVPKNQVNGEYTSAICDQDAVCIPIFETRCLGNTAQVCNGTGYGWTDVETCVSPQTCVNGACE